MPGAAVGILLIASAFRAPILNTLVDQPPVAACLTGGAVGAVVSVMAV